MTAPLGRRAALGALGAIAAAGACSAARVLGDDQHPARFAYGDHPSQYAEVSVPGGPTPAPVVVILHGGFWLTGLGAELGRPLATDLAARGFAAVNVEYRRVGRGADAGGGWPQTGHDVAAAVDALATEGQRLARGRLDLNRVAAIGHSAGGQLAAWLAARPPGAVPLTAVVIQAGVLDLVTAAEQRLGADAVPNFLGATPAARPDVYADASPIARLPAGLPSVCVHGRADTVVPIEQSRRFVAAAVAAGDHSRLVEFDGDHFAPITVGTPAWQLCTEALEQLLG